MRDYNLFGLQFILELFWTIKVLYEIFRYYRGVREFIQIKPWIIQGEQVI